MFHKAKLIYHTVKYLKPSQLFFYIVRRAFPTRKVKSPTKIAMRENLSALAPLAVEGIVQKNGNFSFLNSAMDVGTPGSINWNPKEAQRLWKYNLHYFDYLRQESVEEKLKIELIEDWIDNNPQGSEPAWEPFTTSLRIVNWVFFLTLHAEKCSQKVKDSLYVQTLWLEKNDERHILANHYFENLKAMCFAGVYFKGVKAEKFLKKSNLLLVKELREQTLADGGHYERSPQYHDIMLENFIDILNIAINNPMRFSKEFTDLLCNHCEQALRFSSKIKLPNNSISLINDSAHGVSQPYDALVSYYSAVSGKVIDSSAQVGAFECTASGFFGYKNDSDYLIVDAGDIQPSYQPGHTHCSMLSYELLVGGERLVVDTGVGEYEPGEVRRFCRSTAEHNTISVDGAEQSEIWGEFRIGRRAKIKYAALRACDKRTYFNGCYVGFPSLNSKIEHEREFSYLIDDEGKFVSLVVSDEIRGRSVRRAIECNVKFHPDVKIEKLSSQRFILTTKRRHKYSFEVRHGVKCTVRNTLYYPGFGAPLPTGKLVLSVEDCLPSSVGYIITKFPSMVA